MEIECDLEDDGQLDELEVQRYSDNHCDDEFGNEIKVKPYKCSMDPWEPGKFVMLTYDSPPMNPIVAAVIMIIVCLICCCIVAVAVAGQSKTKGTYNEMSEEG